MGVLGFARVECYAEVAKCDFCVSQGKEIPCDGVVRILKGVGVKITFEFRKTISNLRKICSKIVFRRLLIIFVRSNVWIYNLISSPVNWKGRRASIESKTSTWDVP